MDQFELKKRREVAERTIAIDFDGVIHNDTKGYHDGTIYGEPIFGVENALKLINQKYRVVLYSCKSNSGRKLIDGKTGPELVREWLVKHNLDQYVEDIVNEKPWAMAYIDDRGIRFSNWAQTLADLEQHCGLLI